jgi:hypothetical protein
MTPDDADNLETPLNPEPAPASGPPTPEAEPAPDETPARPRVVYRAPGRYLVTPSGPNDDRFVLDTLRNVLVCIRQKDGARRLHFYTSEPPDGHRQLAASALSGLTGAFPAEVPEDAELLQPITALPQFLRVLDMSPPVRQEFILATAGPRLYRPHLNEFGQLYNLEPILSCCSGWSSAVPYNNEIGDIYAWFAWQPPLPRHF